MLKYETSQAYVTTTTVQIILLHIPRDANGLDGKDDSTGLSVAQI